MVGDVSFRMRVLRHALVLPIQEDLSFGEGKRHSPHGVVCLPREFWVYDASISQLRSEFRASLQNERERRIKQASTGRTISETFAITVV